MDVYYLHDRKVLNQWLNDRLLSPQPPYLLLEMSCINETTINQLTKIYCSLF